jgi:hypothetical protein
MSSTTPEVDAWFADAQHPLEPAMQRVREIILGADPRMLEVVQYGTVHSVCGRDLCSFVQLKNRRQVTLMFNAAGRLVEARADELQALARAWCAHTQAARKPRP